MVAPAGEKTDPGVIWKIGTALVTARLAVWLSRVTARGVATTSVSLSLLRNDNTAFTPSASRKAVVGLKPLAVSTRSLGHLVASGWLTLSRESTGACCRLFPNENFCPPRVPLQSMPRMLLGLLEVSSNLA